MLNWAYRRRYCIARCEMLVTIRPRQTNPVTRSCRRSCGVRVVNWIFLKRLRVTSRLNSRTVSIPRPMESALSRGGNVSNVACVSEQVLRLATTRSRVAADAIRSSFIGADSQSPPGVERSLGYRRMCIRLR